MIDRLKRWLGIGLVVTVEPVPEIHCTCGTDTNRHAGRCAQVRTWLEGFGIDDSTDPWTGRRYESVDLSNTRFAK